MLRILAKTVQANTGHGDEARKFGWVRPGQTGLCGLNFILQTGLCFTLNMLVDFYGENPDKRTDPRLLRCPGER